MYDIRSGLTRTHSASGLGQASAEDICQQGGYVAVLDRNEEDGKAIERKLHPAAKFFLVDVTETESIAAAVSGAAEWAEAMSKPLGGLIPAAGVGHPGLVRRRSPSYYEPTGDITILNFQSHHPRARPRS